MGCVGEVSLRKKQKVSIRLSAEDTTLPTGCEETCMKNGTLEADPVFAPSESHPQQTGGPEPTPTMRHSEECEPIREDTKNA
jgi:hypothetical protein